MFNIDGNQRKSYLVRNVSITSFFRGCGVICGLILDALILAYFGLSGETDAFFVAWSIPLLIINTFDIQAPKVLIPMLSSNTVGDGREATANLLNSFITVIMALFFLVALAGTAFSKIMIPVQAPGLQGDTIDLSIRLSLILYWLIPIRGIGIIYQSYLYFYHHYAVPSSAKLIISGSAVLAVLLFHKEFAIYSVAYGLLIGSVLYLALLIYVSRTKGFRYKFVSGINDRRLMRYFRLFIYPLSGHALGETRVLIENFLSSFLGAGSVSILRYSSRIIASISGVLLSAAVTTTLPVVSSDAAAKKFEEMKKMIRKGIKMLSLISLPLCTWLIFASKPLLMLLFERGKFTEADATQASIIIALMVPYVLLGRIISITQTPFYGILEMKIPFLSTAVSLSVNIAAIFILYSTAGIYSFPISLSCAAIATTVYMAVMLEKRFGRLGWGKLTDFEAKLIGATGVAAIGLMAGSRIHAFYSVDDLFGKALFLFVPTVLGAISFIAALRLFKVIQFDFLFALLRSSKA